MRNELKVVAAVAILISAGVGGYLVMQNLGNGDMNGEQVALSSDMFDGFLADLDYAVSLGIVEGKTESSAVGPLSASTHNSLVLSFVPLGSNDLEGKNYLVKIDTEGNTEEVRFSKEDKDLEQDNIDGYVYKMYIYEKFVYIPSSTEGFEDMVHF